jgi:hypothetical protein
LKDFSGGFLEERFSGVVSEKLEASVPAEFHTQETVDESGSGLFQMDRNSDGGR